MTLPRPYYQDAHVTLYHGDSRELLPQLPMAGLCLTDPPYGHGELWQGGTWGAKQVHAEAREWDAKTIDFMDTVLRCASSHVIWGGNYYAMPPSRCWLAWVKTARIPTMADMELAWTSINGPAKTFLGNRNHQQGGKYHGAQKPLALMKWCLSFFPQVDSVIDPFAGSGTTLVAAKAMRIQSIGIEKEERFCAIIAERLKQESLTFDLA